MNKLHLLLLALFLLSGCALFSHQAETPMYAADARLIAASHTAVDRLLASTPPTKRLDRQQPIIVASLVNIDDLQSSRLGRTISEQLSTRLTMNGYTVIELKLRGNIFVKEGAGELLLSRELKEITRNHQAQAVLVGTYAPSRGSLFVDIKLVGVGDNQVIAAHDYALPIDGDIRAMLWEAGSR